MTMHIDDDDLDMVDDRIRNLAVAVRDLPGVATVIAGEAMGGDRGVYWLSFMLHSSAEGWASLALITHAVESTAVTIRNADLTCKLDPCVVRPWLAEGDHNDDIDHPIHGLAFLIEGYGEKPIRLLESGIRGAADFWPTLATR